MTSLQLFDALDAATEAALRASIDRFGVLVAVTKAQCPGDAELHGAILDGHHRSRIAGELGVKFAESWVAVANADEAREIARTLNTDRRHLTPQQIREQIIDLAAPDETGKRLHSQAAIAKVVGIPQQRVSEIEAQLTANGELKPAAAGVGLDGRVRRPAQVHVKPSETKRAPEALSVEAPLGDGVVVDLKRAERIGREHKADQRRATPVQVAEHDDVRIEHGPFQDALVALDEPGCVVISDPPYPREHLDQYTDLAVSAATWGAKTLVLLVGQSILPDVIERVGGIWQYRWCLAYLTPGPATRVWNSSIGSAWKPVLVFDDGSDRSFVTSDVVTSSGDDKLHHHWGQDADAFASLVQRFTDPGDLVVDPFLGGGTTALVARRLGRRFVGCDVDAAAVHAAIDRLAAS